MYVEKRKEKERLGERGGREGREKRERRERRGGEERKYGFALPARVPHSKKNPLRPA